MISTWPRQGLLGTFVISRTWFKKWTLHVKNWLTHIGCICHHVRRGSHQSMLDYVHIWTRRSQLGICHGHGRYSCLFWMHYNWSLPQSLSHFKELKKRIRAVSASGMTHCHILPHVRNERVSKQLTYGQNCWIAACWNLWELYYHTLGCCMSWKPWHLGIYRYVEAVYRWGCSTNYMCCRFFLKQHIAYLKLSFMNMGAMKMLSVFPLCFCIRFWRWPCVSSRRSYSATSREWFTTLTMNAWTSSVTSSLRLRCSPVKSFFSIKPFNIVMLSA